MGLLDGKRGAILGVANDKSIAWACAQACAAEGASLVFSYIDPVEKRVRALVDEHMPGVPVLPCDVADDDSVASFFSEAAKDGPLDFVVHSVAYAEREDLKNPYVETPRDHFHTALDISAYSLVAVARAARQHMPDGGSIVAMTYYGSQKVIPNYNVMGVAKAALEASARYLAHDLGPAGIRVNCVSAGPLRTLSASAIAGMRKMLGAFADAAPLRRNIEAEEVGKATLYLVSDLSSGVSGEIHHVDCGFHAMGMNLPEE